ncbi:MarR family winged helix-turn-helix transcriptional regulator [Agriterribacter humi]|jgi:DNA-binding MarR family transcriptional regulator|uniref:MarR family winged helix-turn-helix transcriptional regulator n=1 Tax=Agriterribacter humi TaxID=1104781 RepID=UPI001265A19E|nr:MarR family winged helix-turn-helix transcriptional regulator [Agriterribacter humi]
MNYQLLKDLIDLSSEFEHSGSETGSYSKSIDGFKKWIIDTYKTDLKEDEPDWEGKNNGRSPESVIASSIVHMNRFGKTYFKAAIDGSEFSTQDDVIYMIILKFYPSITKMELIKRNVHEKPAGMQIINRLIAKEWVKQSKSETDKRSKVLNITPKGLKTLDDLFFKVRQATNIVSGDLTHDEKMQLIRLLNKLDDFHQPIYSKNLEPAELLKTVLKEINKN